MTPPPDSLPLDLTLPLERGLVQGLRAGQAVRLSGSVLAARDAAHRRLAAALSAGDPLPIDLRGELIYYVGPTPARPGAVIGAAGPTTAMRMDPFTPPLLGVGLLAMLGKGDRGPVVRAAVQRHGAVYFIAVGGTGALLSAHIRTVDVVAYADLGTEAIRRLVLDRFPAIVALDTVGGSIFETGRANYRQPEKLAGLGD